MRPFTLDNANRDFIRDFIRYFIRYFIRDFKSLPGTTFVTSDDKTFATGFKDTLPITSGWQCNQDNNVNSKMGVAPSPVRCPDAPPDC